MQRLVVFGCSYPAGFELPDLVQQSEPDRRYKSVSKFAWPELVGKKLGIDVENNSVPGISNAHIAYKVLNYQFRSTDRVYISWTFPNRWCVIEPNSQQEINYWSKDPASVAYFDHVYSEYNHSLDLYKNANLIEQLISPQVECLHHSLIKSSHRADFSWNQTEFVDLCWDRVMKGPGGDRAADGRHPGVNSHSIYAEQVLNL